jgi:hypothetical protein
VTSTAADDGTAPDGVFADLTAIPALGTQRAAAGAALGDVAIGLIALEIAGQRRRGYPGPEVLRAYMQAATRHAHALARVDVIA